MILMRYRVRSIDRNTDDYRAHAQTAGRFRLTTLLAFVLSATLA